MASLPTEIITEILSRLPVKSLLRFLIVCKSWYSLIKTPNFIKLHLNQTLISKSDRHILLSCPFLLSSELDLHHNHLSFSELNYPLKSQKVFQLISSCNGVVCISTISKNELFLYNPLTNSHRKLPSNRIPVPDPDMMVLGFGYDSKNDDYKVLRIVQRLGGIVDSENKAQVYSFNNNSWKCIEGIPYNLYHGYFRGALVNEALHYVVTQESHYERLFIARFDLRTESFSLIDCPNYDEKPKGYSTFRLIELGGCLCLLINSKPCDEFDDELMDVDWLGELEYVELWVMKQYGNKESWVKLFRISQPHIFGIETFIRALVYSKDGRRILLVIDSEKYCWYDLESKNVERITAHGVPDEFCRTITFIGSLVSLEDKMVSERRTVFKENHEEIACHT